MFIKGCEFAPCRLHSSTFFLNQGWKLFCPIILGNTTLLNLPKGSLQILAPSDKLCSKNFPKIPQNHLSFSNSVLLGFHLLESVLIFMSQSLRSLGDHRGVASLNYVHQLLKYLPSLRHNVDFEHPCLFPNVSAA